MKKNFLIAIVFTSLLFIYASKSQPVITDFQVNENATNRWGQDAPLVLVHGNNNYMIVWKDNRELVGIFAQIFSSDGTPLGDNFHLEGAQTANLLSETFAAAADENGNFVIAWRGGGTYSRIFAQLFNGTGVMVGEKFQVTEYAGNATESLPSVAFGTDGTFIISCGSKSPQSLYGDIFARRFAPDGTPLGSEFKVNGDFGSMTRQENPDISSNSKGEFVIAWEDFRVDFNGGDIYAQRYDSSGTKIGGNIYVDQDSPKDLIRQTDPVCSLNDSGNFVVVWNTRAWDHSNPGIYAQCFDWDGKRKELNFKVTDSTYSLASTQPKEPAVAMNENGEFLITWSDNRNNNEDIYTQYYGSDGAAIGNNYKINDDKSETAQSSPDVAADNNGDFILAWCDSRNDGYGSQIYMQKYAENGSLVEENFHTTNEETVMVATQENDPSILVDKEGAFMVVWVDNSYQSGIYAQGYESNGTPIDTNFRIDNGLGAIPKTAMNDNENILITWSTGGLLDTHIYGQIFSNNGETADSNFIISDDSAYVGYLSEYAVSELGSNNFIIVWPDKRNDAFDIFAQRIDGSGTALDGSIKVNDDQGSDSYPAVAVNDSGTILIAWVDGSHEGTSAIYAQLYTPQGAALGANFKINDNTSGGYLRNTAITALDKGQFIVVWTDYTDGDIYAQRIAGNGTHLDSTFQVGPDNRRQLQPPAVAADDAGNFIISWVDNRNQVYPDLQEEVFAQRFNNEGIPIGPDFTVSGNITLPYEYAPDVKLFNNKIYTTWAERGRFDLGTGVDIWANVLDWDNPVGINDEKTRHIPAAITLNQNYPNPFNPVTTISYQLSASSHVNLNIFNVLGQKVITLVSERQPAGEYTVNWDASSMVSGIYLYRLEVDGSMQSKKMLLVR